MKNVLRMALILFTACAMSAPAMAQAQSSPKSPLKCSRVGLLAARFHMSHVQYQKWDEAHLDRMVELYADSMDSSKALMTQAEFEAARREVKKAFRDVHEGSCDALMKLHKSEIKRHAEMEAHVRKVLSKPGLKVDRSLELIVDSDERPRPKSEGEQEELRRKLIHFQLATYVSNGTKLEEARKKLVHRYELVTKRAKEMHSEPELLTIYLRTYALALDPHSTYFSPDDLEDFRISMELSLEGIGAVLRSRDGYTIVEEVVAGGAAARQGELKRNDKIIGVAQGEDGEVVDIIDMSLRDVVRKIRGKKGTKVRLVVLRQGESTERLEIEITRDKIDLKKQAAKLRWHEVKRGGEKHKLAIIELPSFYSERVTSKGRRTCADDVRELLEQAKAEGADGVMLDLSSNGGGALDAAVDITGLFIARGPVVGVSAPGERPQLLRDRDSNVVWSGPLVVLTSHASASASEILAGALKDYGRAIIVGDRQTFGKGTVQNVISLPMGFGALKVTTAMFFLPGGASTQHAGVSADIVVPSLLSGLDIGEKFQPGALPMAKVKTFKAPEAQSSKKDEKWDPVSAEQLKKLASASSKRIARSEEFKELEEEIAKIKKNKGKIKLAELFEEGDKKGDDDKDDKDDDELTPQALEALEILADYIEMN